MNWSSGLFRMWIIFAFLWVSVGYLVADFPYWSLKVQTAASSKEFVDRQYLKIVKQIDDQEETETEKWLKQYSDEYKPKLQAARELEEVKANLRLLLLAVFLPPFLLLIVGLSFST